MTTIQINDDLKIKLLRLASRLQMQLGRRVSIEEVIRYLLRETDKNEKLFLSFFGCLRGESREEIYDLLKDLRGGEEKRLESSE